MRTVRSQTLGWAGLGWQREGTSHSFPAVALQRPGKSLMPLKLVPVADTLGQAWEDLEEVFWAVVVIEGLPHTSFAGSPV